MGVGKHQPEVIGGHLDDAIVEGVNNRGYKNCGPLPWAGQGSPSHFLGGAGSELGL